MPPNPSSPCTSRLENLSFGAQGAAFELDGRLVRLDSGGYAAPVASLQGFYHQALADFYQRSAEIARQQAAARLPLLGRLLSWIGGFFRRAPSATPHGFDPSPAPPVVASISPRAAAESARHPPEPPHAIKLADADRGTKPVSPRGTASAPSLQVVFADRDGVHVIWQLTSVKHDPTQASRDQPGAKAAGPRLELTYRLDSAIAQRLQDCYGQLTQLGYKIAGLETVQAQPEKPAAGKKSPRATPDTPSPVAPAASDPKAAPDISKAEPKPSPRKPRLETAQTQTVPGKSAPEPPNRDPGFLPGM